MSGTIAMTHDARWSAASWLFDWTVEFLANNIEDSAAEAHLREIIEDNIGWLDLGDLSAETRARLLRRMNTELVETADKTLPATITNRTAVLDLLRELTQLAERVGADVDHGPHQ
jgi:hypothetical protein